MNLKKGDVVLTGKGGLNLIGWFTRSHFSHAGLYIDPHILNSTVGGVQITSVDKFFEAPRWAILRLPELSPREFAKLNAIATGKIGYGYGYKSYATHTPLAVLAIIFKRIGRLLKKARSPHYEPTAPSCSVFVAECYLKSTEIPINGGIHYTNVTPQDIYDSPYFVKVAEKS